ncbi:hypothetical protein FMG_P0026 (plasmid) [Finegoldia magna ATCC 29328]|uniref:Uncharacterized protein n=1 Tax=Finegoldia magna (strain ATCC 29328 / DSM 20472 / WAL 2508) TaxID=334413 RepID=B0S484_FINM2|nr:hypothetical protein FMG_P0026 [Finegoldia magna ATCC 29328]
MQFKTHFKIIYRRLGTSRSYACGLCVRRFICFDLSIRFIAVEGEARSPNFKSC